MTLVVLGFWTVLYAVGAFKFVLWEEVTRMTWAWDGGVVGDNLSALGRCWPWRPSVGRSRPDGSPA